MSLEETQPEKIMNTLARIVRRVAWLLIERTPEWCVTHWWMKLAYFDHARREAVMVAWPLNYLVTLAWMANLAWCRYRHRPSWIDREVSKRPTSGDGERWTPADMTDDLRAGACM